MSGNETVAFVGDSLTAGGLWQEWLPHASVHNLGVDGDTTDDLLLRLPRIIDVEPDTVVLLIGTNDLAWRRTVEHVVRNVETALVTLRRSLPETGILVQSVLPREAEFSESIREINRHLWQFAPTVRAQYLDLWPVFSVDGESMSPEYSDDSLHINSAGYQAWLTELTAALDRLVEAAPMTRPLRLPSANNR